MSKVFGIEFKRNSKAYNFVSDIDDIKLDDYVIVDTEKGYQYGKVVKINIEIKGNINNLKPIIRKASTKDQNTHSDNILASERALKNAKEIAKELKLDMNIIEAIYTFDKKQLLFNFIASERIDFRELVKKLASIYHTRIELRQIGVRDKAKEVGGIGQCGRCLCCNVLNNSIESITINMAKNQNIALNPTKINGCCGRLLCCLQYEDDLYADNRKNLPSVGENIDTKFGKGFVESVDVLNNRYIVSVNGEKKEINLVKENFVCERLKK